MKKMIAVALVVGGSLFGFRRHGVILYAQSLPYNSTFTWSPNPVGDNVSLYTVTLDSGTPVVVLASTCTTTLCSSSVPINAFGSHTISVFATNQTLSGGTGVTGTPQNGPSASLMFSLNQAPNKVASPGVK